MQCPLSFGLLGIIYYLLVLNKLFRLKKNEKKSCGSFFSRNYRLSCDSNVIIQKWGIYIFVYICREHKARI